MFSLPVTSSLLLGILVGSCLTLSSTTLLRDLLRELSHGSSASLSEKHDFEALEVREIGAGLLGGKLASLGQSGPLFVQFEGLCFLIDRSSSFSTLQIQSELGQAESLQGVNHSFEVWSVNEHAVLVSDVSDDDLLAVVSAVVNERNTAALNEVVSSWL